MDKMKSLNEAGSTIVMSTHDMDLVRQFASHVLVLIPGKLRFAGTPQELFAQPEVMREAHLLAEKTLTQDFEQFPSSHGLEQIAQQETSSGEWGTVATQVRRGFTQRLNPPWHLLFTLGAIGVALGAHTLPQALAVFLLPVGLMFTAARLGPIQVVKRLSPFLGFYILYVWTMTAYAKVSPGTPVFRILWMHLSFPGLILGLILALRMLATVSFGLLLISSTDITKLVVGLSQNFHVPPKFAYGTLAGIRFAPLFQSEWGKLRQARQLRGKDSRWRVMRPITYALPLLTQAVRMSERVACAMEARGFFGRPADLSQGRTYYRIVRIHWWDFAYGIGLMATVTGLLLWIH
jgi:energy-coupling factor transport system ATP-binding protein